MSRRLISLLLLCASTAAAAVARAQDRDRAPRLTGRVVLVPIDDRPATTQFTEMIGRIGDVEVVLPPPETLGVFYAGGRPGQIIGWLRGLDYSRVDAVILSADMLAYGGLTTSRTPATPQETARQRLGVIGEIRRAHPRIPVYAFNVAQRVALSATAASRSYRDRLARRSVLADQTGKQPDPKLKAEFEAVGRELPPEAIEDYLAARRRNLQINFAMLDLVKQGVVDELLLLQDDAHPFGLHRRDQAALRERIGLLVREAEQAKLYDGADEGSSVLLSRAVLRKYKLTPRIRVVYSSEAGRRAVGVFEDHPVEVSVERQISAAGGRIVPDGAEADYTPYVNAPAQTGADFKDFLARMIADLRGGRRVAVADVLFPNRRGGSDPRPIEALGRERLPDRVIGYASWNTPGGTLGTVVPRANMYALARRRLFDGPQRAARIEEAQVSFLLHRHIGDYGYHSLVRPAVNRHVREQLKLETDELDPQTYERINRMAAERLSSVARDIFDRYFRGRAYALAGGKGPPREIHLEEMTGLEVRLPWSRTLEVRVDYELRFRASRAEACARVVGAPPLGT